MHMLGRAMPCSAPNATAAPSGAAATAALSGAAATAAPSGTAATAAPSGTSIARTHSQSHTSCISIKLHVSVSNMCFALGGLCYALSWLSGSPSCTAPHPFKAPISMVPPPNCPSRSPDCPSSLPNGSRRSDGVVGPDGHLLGLLERPEAGERCGASTSSPAAGRATSSLWPLLRLRSEPAVTPHAQQARSGAAMAGWRAGGGANLRDSLG